MEYIAALSLDIEAHIFWKVFTTFVVYGNVAACMLYYFRFYLNVFDVEKTSYIIM